MIIKFFDGDSIMVNETTGDKVKLAINAGAEWVKINGNLYKVSSISKLETKNSIRGYSSKLNLPDIPIPKELQAAYDSRTIRINQKRIGGKNA